MNASFVIHRIIAIVFNLFLITWIFYVVIRTNNDKSPILFVVYYAVLSVLNLVIAVVLSFLKTRHYKIYRQIVLAELLLFVPFVFIVGNL